MRGIPLTFEFEGKSYTNVLPVDSEVQVGITYGIFEVDGNKHWMEPYTKWEYAAYNEIRFTFQAAGDFVTDDWATEARSLPPVTIVWNNTVYNFTGPVRTYVHLWKVYGEFSISVPPPPMTNWRVYAHKPLEGYPDTVELKYNVDPERDLPGYSSDMIHKQIIEVETAYVPRDARVHQMTTVLDHTNGLRARPTWAFREVGGNWSVGFNAFTSGLPLLYIPKDSADDFRENVATMLDNLGSIWGTVIRMGDVPYTPPPPDTLDFAVEAPPAAEDPSPEIVPQHLKTDPLNDSLPSTEGCNFPTYAVRYPELMDLYGTDLKLYIEEYLLQGAKASRDCRPDATVWSAKAYREQNPDHVGSLTDAKDLWEHYVTTGRHQGLRAGAGAGTIGPTSDSNVASESPAGLEWFKKNGVLVILLVVGLLVVLLIIFFLVR